MFSVGHGNKPKIITKQNNKRTFHRKYISQPRKMKVSHTHQQTGKYSGYEYFPIFQEFWVGSQIVNSPYYVTATSIDQTCYLENHEMNRHFALR